MISTSNFTFLLLSSLAFFNYSVPLGVPVVFNLSFPLVSRSLVHTIKSLGRFTIISPHLVFHHSTLVGQLAAFDRTGLYRRSLSSVSQFVPIPLLRSSYQLYCPPAHIQVMANFIPHSQHNTQHRTGHTFLGWLGTTAGGGQKVFGVYWGAASLALAVATFLFGR